MTGRHRTRRLATHGGDITGSTDAALRTAYCSVLAKTRTLLSPYLRIESGAMAQVKFYGLEEQLSATRVRLSETVHRCVMEVLGLPKGKRAHRFFGLEREDFLMPEGRTDSYTIVEIAMMSGRSTATRKRLVRMLFEQIEKEVGISQTDLEICIMESPPENWGFRGLHGDEASLPYEVEV